MNEQSFAALVAAVNNEGFAENKLNVVREAAARNFFHTGQVKALIDQMAFSETKLKTLEACSPRIVDRENAFTLFEAFTFSADKQRAKEILKRNGY